MTGIFFPYIDFSQSNFQLVYYVLICIFAGCFYVAGRFFEPDMGHSRSLGFAMFFGFMLILLGP